MVSSLSLDLIVQIVILVLDLTNLLIWQVDSPQHVWLRISRSGRCDGNARHLAPIGGRIDLLATSAQEVAHAFLLREYVHALGRVVRNLLRLLLVVEVDVLLDRVTLGEHVQDFALVDSLLDAVGVTFLLHVHDFFALNIEHVLAAFECSLKLSFFFLSFA